jgi:hypothetical protein
MPTYVIDGKSYSSATPLTDAELEELSGAAQPSAPGTGAIIAEALRKGITNIPAYLRGAGEAAAHIAQYQAKGQIPPDISGAFSAGVERVREPAMRLLGGTGAEPTTTGQRIIAGGAEAVTDPMSYMFGPLATTGRLRMFGQAVMRPTEQAVMGAGGQAGAIAGQYAGEKVNAPVVGSIAGGLLGGAGAGYGMGTALRAVPLTGKAYDASLNLINKIRGTAPEDELLRDVDNRINNIFVAAGAADPNFMTALEEAAKAQKSVSLRAPGGAEVKMPLSALLADNPVINSFIQNLSARDPVFKAQFGAQYTAAKQALTANQIRLFGDPSKVNVNIKPVDIAKAQAKKTQTIDDEIASLSRNQEVDPTAFGQRVEALVAKKEDEARKSVTPLYTEAFDIAKTKGVELPAASVDDIYNFVAGTQASDIFKTFPSIYNRVRSKFRPAETEPSPILTAEGKPTTAGGMEFSAATVEDLDSLKKEINRQLRKTTEPADIRLLTELKQRVGGHIDSLDPDFVAAYRNADNAYLQKVGLPFSADTLKLIDRKKFVEQIAPALIGNKSNVTQFLEATGDAGMQVVRDAFVDSFSKAALKNDVIDPKAANRWLDKNKGGVSLIPGLDDELRGSVDNVQALLNYKTRLNEQFKRVAGDQIISSEGLRNPQELVNKMYGSVDFTNKFMRQYGADKDAVNAARSFMLDDIVTSGDPIGLLNDRSKSAVFNRVFGPTYAQKVADFATVANRLQRDITDVSFRGETVPKTPIEAMTGIPPEQIISRIYNPVSGATYAITSLFSKFWAKKASEITETRLKDLLLNPTDAVKVFAAVKPRVDQIDRAKIDEALRVGKKYGINWVKDAAEDVKSGAIRGVLQTPEQPAAQPAAQPEEATQ